MRKWIVALAAVTALPLLPTTAAGAGGEAEQGSFVARALPFPALQPDIYYLQKGTCIDGVEGIHKVSKAFHAPEPGTLDLYVEGFSGDWDLYLLDPRGERLAASDKAQVLDGAESKERATVAVRRGQQLQMVACNWLAEPEITVHFELSSKEAGSADARRPGPPPQAEPVGKRTVHEVEAAGGPIGPLWEWDPSDLEITAGDKVLWSNETASAHHMTPYGGPWKDVATKHLANGDTAGFVFRKPGRYLYRCDIAFAGIEHSYLVGDECVGMCGEIVVEKREKKA